MRRVRTEEQRIMDKEDKLIERAYYKHATGTQINIMDIPKLYDDVRRDIRIGKDIDVAVVEAIARYKAN